MNPLDKAEVQKLSLRDVLATKKQSKDRWNGFSGVRKRGNGYAAGEQNPQSVLRSIKTHSDVYLRDRGRKTPSTPDEQRREEQGVIPWELK